jgi:glycosyltransferase involved in cell wall biosynthesis
MSMEGTRDIVHGYATRFSHIRMIDNPGGLKPVALNIGIDAPDSDILMRIDAHAVYAPDYISRLVAGLIRYDADNIGGVRETDCGSTLVSRAIATAISHPFAAGNAHWRTGATEVKEVGTVFCGCYRRTVFHRIGKFNERLIRAQDREFNERLRSAGGRIVLDPSVRCTYFPRTTLRAYCQWTIAGAFWLFYARSLTQTPMISSRNLVPPAFVVWHGVVLTLLVLGPVAVIIGAIPIVTYWTINIWLSGAVAFRERNLQLWPLASALFALTHIGYGIGALSGWLKSILSGRVV